MWLAEKRYLLGKLDPQSVSLIYPKVGPFQSFCLTYFDNQSGPRFQSVTFALWLGPVQYFLAAVRAPLRSLCLPFVAYSRTPKAGSTIALKRAAAAALTRGVAPP